MGQAQITLTIPGEWVSRIQPGSSSIASPIGQTRTKIAKCNQTLSLLERTKAAAEKAVQENSGWNFAGLLGNLSFASLTAAAGMYALSFLENFSDPYPRSAATVFQDTTGRLDVVVRNLLKPKANPPSYDPEFAKRFQEFLLRASANETFAPGLFASPVVPYNPPAHPVAQSVGAQMPFCGYREAGMGLDNPLFKIVGGCAAAGFALNTANILRKYWHQKSLGSLSKEISGKQSNIQEELRKAEIPEADAGEIAEIFKAQSQHFKNYSQSAEWDLVTKLGLNLSLGAAALGVYLAMPEVITKSLGAAFVAGWMSAFTDASSSSEQQKSEQEKMTQRILPYLHGTV